MRAFGAEDSFAAASSARASAESSPVRSAEKARVHSLDMLRGVMALCVALYHYNTWTHVFTRGTTANSLIAAFGLYSVEGFFVVSGFCFFHLYRDVRFGKQELARFHIKRFFRIAPLYYLAVFLNLGLSQPWADSFTWWRLLENLSLSFGLFHPNHSLVLGGWSIGIEYVFYLALPLLVLLMRKPGLIYVAALLALLPAIPYAFEFVQAAPEARKFHVYVHIPNHAFFFLLGGAIADLRSRVSFRIPAALVFAALSGLLVLLFRADIVFADHFEVVLGTLRLLNIALCTLVVLVAAFASHANTRVGAPLVWLGDLSYSVYLLHPFGYLLVSTLLPTAGAGATFALSLVTTLLFAALSYHLLERPCMALGQRLSRAV
jgi:exopolysaccharide production protein ExoZ